MDPATARRMTIAGILRVVAESTFQCLSKSAFDEDFDFAGGIAVTYGADAVNAR